MVTFCVVWTGPLTLSRQNSFTSMGSPIKEEWITSFSTQFHLSLCGIVVVTQTWQLQNEPVSMSSSLSWVPLCYYTHGPIYNFGSNYDWDHLRIGIWRLTSVNLRCGMVESPVPSNSNNQPRGSICSARSSQKGSLCWRPEHLSHLMWLFPSHPPSLGPNESVPLSEQWGQG